MHLQIEWISKRNPENVFLVIKVSMSHVNIFSLRSLSKINIFSEESSCAIPLLLSWEGLYMLIGLKSNHIVKGTPGDQGVRLMVAGDCDQYPNIAFCRTVESVSAGNMFEWFLFLNALFVHTCICHSTILHINHMYFEFGIAQSMSFYNIAIVNRFLAGNCTSKI